MNELTVPAHPRETLDQRVQRLGVKPRACRDCRMFVPEPTGLGFGWCNAHRQHVKLAQGAIPFFSQCQFKALSRARVTEAPVARP
jgi:hypothetical protein